MTTYIYVFSGEVGNFPGGVFDSIENAENWISLHKLTGILSYYPLNTGVFEWAVSSGFIKPEKAAKIPSREIGGFSSYVDHAHYEDGKRVG